MRTALPAALPVMLLPAVALTLRLSPPLGMVFCTLRVTAALPPVMMAALAGVPPTARTSACRYIDLTASP